MEELICVLVVTTAVLLTLAVGDIIVNALCRIFPAVRDWFEGNETEEDEDDA